MNAQLSEIWEKTLNIIKEEITEVSFNTWIKSITPIEIVNDTIKYGVPNDFTLNILQSRYNDLIINALSHITSKRYKVEFTILSEETNQLEQKDKNKKHIIITEPKDYVNNLLNSKYKFDSFVIGDSNRFAHAASLAVAESPGKAYNPLFIYGGSGLGKTHLMHAIGHYILNINPKAKVAYLSSEKFTNEFINAIRDNKNEEFRNKYRNVDILLIDDIQFIAGKDQTQEEFFHTFNALHEVGKQIIISSDRPPKEIPTLENRLLSRFEWGLSVDIKIPDFETRIAILKKKADIDNLDIPNEVLIYIATTIKSNIRELEGALIRIVAYSSLTNKEINAELAAEALKDIISNRATKQVTIALIQEIVSNYFNLNIEDFKSPKRTKNITYPRQMAMYLCRKLTDMSLPKIGEEFGGRDHTTVIHGYEKISGALNTDDNLKSTIETLTKKINQK